MTGRGLSLRAALFLAAVVLWVVSLLGRWELQSHRSPAWAVAGSVALAAVAAGRPGAPSRRSTVIGLVGTAGCAVAAGLVWHRAGQQAWPLAASALGFVALVAGAGAGVAALAADGHRLLGDRRRPVAAAVAVIPVLAVVAAALAATGWDARPVAGRPAAGSVPPAPEPGALTASRWSASLTSATVAGAGAGGVYVTADPGPRAQVQALDPATGRVRWSWSRPAHDDAPVVVAGAGVVAVSFGGGTAVLDAATGRERTRFATPFGGVTLAAPAVTGAQVVFVGRGDAVRSYSTTTGALLWARSSAPPGCGGQASLQTVTALPDDASAAALLYACTGPASLRIAWAGPAGRHVPQPMTVPAMGPAAPASACLLSAGGGLVGAALVGTGTTVEEWGVDPSTGRLRWSTQPSEAADAPADRTGCLLLAALPSGVVAPVADGTWGLVDPSDGHVDVRYPAEAVDATDLQTAVDGTWAYEVLSPGSDRLTQPPVLRSVDLATGATGAQLPFAVGTRVQALEPTPGGTFVVVTNVGSLNMPATQILTGYR